MRLLVPGSEGWFAGTCIAALRPRMATVVACLFALVGVSIRIWCYRALGNYFTFELAVRPNHKLITTGPYAFVRHPSYTAAMLSFTAATAVYATQGSLAYECRFIYVIWLPLWVLWTSVSYALLVERCVREDRLLHVTFGKEWEAWSQRVRWRLVPWIF